MWFRVLWFRAPSPTPYDRKEEGPERPLRPFPFERRRIGVSPSGKARDFDSRIRWFESSHPSQSFRRLAGFPIFPICDSVAQLAEQLPFKQWVRGSNPRWVTTSEQSPLCSDAFLCSHIKSVIRPLPCSSFPNRNRLCWVAIWFRVQTWRHVLKTVCTFHKIKTV